MKTRAAFIEDARGFADTLQEYISLSCCGIESVGLYGTAEEALAALPGRPADVAVVAGSIVLGLCAVLRRAKPEARA